jgi:poly-gamma-glutamate capsule biosynthesis protein CapA/YwtB (metallophosphatase superfamily)
MKIFISFFIIPFFLALNLFLFNSDFTAKQQNETPKDSVTYATIRIVGDLMCHSTQFNYAKVSADSFDFRGVYSEVKEFLSGADFTIGNLETVTAGKSKGYSGYPFFNAPDDFIYAIKDAGFDLLVTANNHAIDQGEKGITRTIEQILKNGLSYSGTATCEKDRDSIRIFDLNGIKISILAYTENTNGNEIPKGKDYLVNIINQDSISLDIKKARNLGADIVLVQFHFGEEYKREPNTYQKQTVDSTILLGADIIIGSHPHSIQPLNYYKTENAKLDTGLIAYSMGNFISNQRWRYSDAGVILSITLAKNISKDSIYISEVNYLPTWVYRGLIDDKKEYVIIPEDTTKSDSSYKYLNEADLKNMKQAFEDTDYILNLYTNKSNIVRGQ